MTNRNGKSGSRVVHEHDLRRPWPMRVKILIFAYVESLPQPNDSFFNRCGDLYYAHDDKEKFKEALLHDVWPDA